MDIAVESLDENTSRIVLTGRMDIAGSESIEVAFAAAAADKRYLVVDMSGVAFLASIGIRSLFAKAKQMHGRGGKLVIAAPQPQVAQVLDMTGVPQLIPIFPDVESARDRLALTAG